MLAVLMLPGAVHAAASQAKADAVVVTALSLIKDEDLEFGTMLAGPTAGEVVVPPAGPRTKTGGVTLVGNTFFPARFASLAFPFFALHHVFIVLIR